jgi:TRAP-type mannitol/chloroaromatic compound transport system permease small subunit
MQKMEKKTKSLEFIKKTLRIIDNISEWQGKVFSIFILFATFQICFELILRYVFDSPTIWGLEMTIYLCGITYMMSGAYAERFKAHIRVDILYNRWSTRVQAWFDLFVTDVLFFFFCGLLVWHSIDWFWTALVHGRTSGTIWDIPIWPMRLVIVIGSSGLLLAGFGKAVRDVFTLIHGERID